MGRSAWKSSHCIRTTKARLRISGHRLRSLGYGENKLVAGPATGAYTCRRTDRASSCDFWSRKPCSTSDDIRALGLGQPRTTLGCPNDLLQDGSVAGEEAG